MSDPTTEAPPSSVHPLFYNYPTPKEAPETPYSAEIKPVPALRGLPLAIAASAVSNIGPLQTILWKTAGFGGLRDINELEDEQPRYEPTVIPVKDVEVEGGERTNGDRKEEKDYMDDGKDDREGSKSYHSISWYHSQYLSGSLTPTAVAKALLPLIRRDTNPPGQHSVAWLSTNPERVLAAAEASTERYREGKPLGQLDGVPVAVKDEVDVEGMPKCLGSRIDFTPKENITSWCVKKWEEEGAVVLGKTNMHQLGLDTTNLNPHMQTPLNPHSPSPTNLYYTGGSSGGSAHTVSLNLVPLSLGADGGGSIRIPSSFCGLYGLKPSSGRISAAPTPSLAPSCGVIGPLASSIADLRTGYEILARADPSHPTSSLFPPPSQPLHATPPATKHLGIYAPWFTPSACPDPEVRRLVQRALDYYTSPAGGSYTLTPITLPYLPAGQNAHAMTIMSEITSGISPTHIPLFTPANKLLLSTSAATPAHDVLLAQKLRNLLMRHLAFLYRKYPGLIIVSPTTPMRGWKVGSLATDLGKYGASESDAQRLCMRYVWLANFTGCPAISCPVGYVESNNSNTNTNNINNNQKEKDKKVKEEEEEGKGLPIGLMGMGEWGSEVELLRFAEDGMGVLGKGGLKPPGELVGAVGGKGFPGFVNIEAIIGR